jgi:hypothetical protein
MKRIYVHIKWWEEKTKKHLINFLWQDLIFALRSILRKRSTSALAQETEKN